MHTNAKNEVRKIRSGKVMVENVKHHGEQLCESSKIFAMREKKFGTY